MSEQKLKMRELESRTGVGREAIRFYIREGILPTPEKPSINVAHYSEDHVVRLRLIKQLQEEKFMPLDRIKQLLNSVEFTDLSTISNLAEFEFAFNSLVNGEISTTALTLDEACKRTGFSAGEIREMHQRQIIQLMSNEGVETLSGVDVSIIEKWAEIKALGFTDELGYGPDFLLQYVELTSKLANIEVDQFFQAFAAEPVKESAARGAKAVQLVNEMLRQLHSREIRHRVTDYADHANRPG